MIIKKKSFYYISNLLSCKKNIDHACIFYLYNKYLDVTYCNLILYFVSKYRVFILKWRNEKKLNSKNSCKFLISSYSVNQLIYYPHNGCQCSPIYSCAAPKHNGGQLQCSMLFLIPQIWVGLGSCWTTILYIPLFVGCKNSPCVYGTCHESELDCQFTCACYPGFTGKLCDQLSGKTLTFILEQGSFCF